MSVMINYNPEKRSLVSVCNEYDIVPFAALRVVDDYCKTMDRNLDIDKYSVNNKIVFVDNDTTSQYYLEMNYGTIVDNGIATMTISDMQLSDNVIEDILNILKPKKWKVTKHKKKK